MSLTRQIIIAMFTGALAGILINRVWPDSVFVQDIFVNGAFSILGALFISALKMLVVPLVFVSMVCGVTGLSDVGALGRIGIKALVLYLVTTAVAISIGLFLAITFAPGAGFVAGNGAATYMGTTAPPIRDVLVSLVPSNPFMALAQGNMLQIIVFSIFFGVSIIFAGKGTQRIKEIFTETNHIIMVMVRLVMKAAPVGVFCLIARTFSTEGMDVIAPLAGYFLVVVAALLIHALGTYGLLVRFMARLDPLVFFKKMRAAMVFAFSTASSSATMPVTLRSVEKRIGVDNSVASFTVPLGATINMDGTAIMQGVATVFIANVYGVGLEFSDYLIVVLTATLASIGTAGVPGVGLIMLSMVLIQVGLPVEGIALIIGVDRLLDMVRTTVNITGDAAVTCVIARSENALDDGVFGDPHAGLVGPMQK